jgi:hypothetical protein
MSDWQPIATAPLDRDLWLSVIENGEVYELVFPCRRGEHGWIHARTGKPVFIDPTHWSEWSE